MTKVAVTFDILKQYDENVESDLGWTPGEIKIARKILNSNYNQLTLPEKSGKRTIQTSWGQVELLEGDRRVDFLVFTPKQLFVIEVKDHSNLSNITLPWDSSKKSAWKQCSQYMTTLSKEIQGLTNIVGIVLFPNLDISDDLKKAINDYGTEEFSIFSFFSRDINKFSFNRMLDGIDKELSHHPFNYKNMVCAIVKVIPQISVKKFDDCTSDLPLHVLEEEQIKVAKNIGISGDRIIYGVAGSGKTVVLVTKALQINELYGTEKKILVVCHNKPLRRYFEKQLHHTKIEIRTIYSWYNAVLRSWGFEDTKNLLSPEEKKLGFYDQMPLMIEYGLDHGKLLPTYDCILIDEGQDIASVTFRHLKLAHEKEKPNNLFMVFLDNLQSIHERDEDRFRWIDVGINALGRTRYFRKNYRNANKIAEYALDIVRDKLDNTNDLSEELSEKLIDTERIVRSGGQVHSEFWRRSDVNYKIAGEIINQRVDHSIMIIYSKLSDPKQLVNINSALRKLGNHRELIDCSDRELIPDGKIVPIYSVYRCKGLEADVVFYLRIGNEDPELSFVGNTRAREVLYDIETSWK